MKYLKKFNENSSSLNYKELEFDEEMMYQTSAIFNLIKNSSLEITKETIKNTLNEDTFNKLFNKKYMKD